MPTASPVYGTATTITCTLASLASDANLNAGRESAVVNNETDDAIDAMVGGKVTTGTTPTASRQIEVWFYGSWDGTLFSGGCTGSDAAITFASEKNLLRLALVIPTDATSNHTYEWGPVSVAAAFGGIMPRKWGVFIVHNTGVALNATAGNHEIKYSTIKFESA